MLSKIKTQWELSPACVQTNTSQKSSYEKPLIHRRNLISLQEEKDGICHPYTFRSQHEETEEQYNSVRNCSIPVEFQD